jgi:hypothetical protein
MAVDSLGRRYFGAGVDALGQSALGTMLFTDGSDFTLWAINVLMQN